jgi:hypothetical protein
LKKKIVNAVIFGIIAIIILFYFQNRSANMWSNKIDKSEIKIYNIIINNLTIINKHLKNPNEMRSNKNAIAEIKEEINKSVGELNAASVFDGNSNMSFAYLRLLFSDFQSVQDGVEVNDKGKEYIVNQLSFVLSKLPKKIKQIEELPSSSAIGDIDYQLMSNNNSYANSLSH